MHQNNFLYGRKTRVLATCAVSVVLALGSVVTTAFAGDGIEYLDESGAACTQPMDECIDISDKAFADKSGYELGDGWYIVTSSRNFSNRLNITGDAKLILCDGAKANFKDGIRGKSGKLTIYAQSTGKTMGQLVAKADGGEKAGIGGNNDDSNKTEIVICGGKIEAKGDDFGAGIGGGDHGGCGTIKIYGGDVTAEGGREPWWSVDLGGAAGIGSGDAAKEGGTVEIHGGTVNAKGPHYAAGIGTGDEAKKTVDVTITGGDVTAKSASDGAGIGGGNEVSSGNITISGGKVVATGEDGGAGIGGGDEKKADHIIISGGDVTAISKGSGSAIGGGKNGSGGIIEISDGDIKAEAPTHCSAIGGGSSGGNSGTIKITGGVIDAQHTMQSNSTSWVIGCGHNGKMEDLFISDDIVVKNVDKNESATGDDRMNALKKWGHVKLEPQA